MLIRTLELLYLIILIYLAEGLRQLSDEKFYRQVLVLDDSDNNSILSNSELASIELKLKAIVDAHSNLLTSKDIEALFTHFPFKPATFYMLPKLHKPVGPCGLKGRRIVSCINYCNHQQ